MTENKQLDQLAINAIRVLSAESVQKANSGHPGLPMGAAAMTYELWRNHMNFNPNDPQWLNRDRFVLSAGHASMLLYSLLHLFNYDLSIEDLKNFRQWESKTPGHPEYGHTVGVEATTGPLGQGISMAVGMAMAQAHLAARFNQPEYDLFDHFIYVLAGDGCMMEGISSEAASMAGTMKLGRLIVLYDDNDISIEGNTDIAFTEDVGKRHEAYGWQVLHVADGNDTQAVAQAIAEAKADETRPSLIVVRTQIGFGSPLVGSADTHGSPLGAENVTKTRETLNWPGKEPFDVPVELRTYLRDVVEEKATAQAKWNDLFNRYQKAFPEKAGELNRCLNMDTPDLLSDEAFWSFSGSQATRSTSGVCLNRLAERLPNLIGGSADLAPSNKSVVKGTGWFSPEHYEGANIHFGVREHAMAAAANGMALYGGLRPYCATFFVFSDYLKAALRMSALQNLPVMYVLTHDSIGVGEDGPTHEPIEHLASLRSIPNVTVYRPADGKETAAAYLYALQNNGPTCMVLSRQNLPTFDKTGPDALKGGYVLEDSDKIDLILIASGSEVELAMNAAKALKDKGVGVRVVSMPSMEVFERQSEAYRESVLPGTIRNRIAIEAGTDMPWYRYVGLDGRVIGINHFGASAPGELLFEKFGFTESRVVADALEYLKV
ncbi:MAG: transketolase [Clostridiaceae bacterium]|nr:transketolase [Clostridiaceae bacterium]